MNYFFFLIKITTSLSPRWNKLAFLFELHINANIHEDSPAAVMSFHQCSDAGVLISAKTFTENIIFWHLKQEES